MRLIHDLPSNRRAIAVDAGYDLEDALAVDGGPTDERVAMLADATTVRNSEADHDPSL